MNWKTHQQPNDMKVYLLEDDALFGDYVAKIVRKAENVSEVINLESLSDILDVTSGALSFQNIEDPDLIFVDNYIGKSSMFKYVKDLRKNFPFSVILTMSSINDESSAIKTLSEGANQYFLKSESFGNDLIDYFASDDFEADFTSFNSISRYL